MPRNQDPDYELVYAGLDAFRERCLSADDSLFTPGVPIWTLPNIEELHRRFNESPDESNDSFVEKLMKQMSGATDPVIQLMAEVLWLHFSCAHDVSGNKKREHIRRVLGWVGDPVELPAELADALEYGMASTGVAFNTMRAQQLWFVIDFAATWKGASHTEQQEWLAEPWAFKSMLMDVPIEAAYIQRNALLHLIHPETFSDIYSRKHKLDIAKSFAAHLPDDEPDIDRLLIAARQHVEDEGFKPDPGQEYWCLFYWSEVRALWDVPKAKKAKKNEATEASSTGPKIWLFSPGRNAADWGNQRQAGVMAVGWEKLGDLRQYSSPDEINTAVGELYAKSDATPYNDMKAMRDMRFAVQPGDIVVAKKGRKTLIGAGVVTGEYQHDLGFPEFCHRVAVRWALEGEWSVDDLLAMKTLTDIEAYGPFAESLLRAMGTSVEELLTAEGLRHQGPADESPELQPYTRADALSELFIDESMLDDMVELLETKKNLILTGPPGTGKTFLASRLAWVLARQKSNANICRVQFHQAMSYEDFVQGFRPTEGGFHRRNGPFVQFCNQAAQSPELPHVLLIDEINRGNLSRILGELMLLIEPDKRSEEWGTRLAYAEEGEPDFWVPENVHIIGTMNTADRSLALVDYALRRRFAFQHVPPSLAHESFHEHLLTAGFSSEVVEGIVAAFTTLNQRIEADPNLGQGFCIGHSYFCAIKPGKKGWQRLIRTELGPLLREYWFDDLPRAEQEIKDLMHVG